MPDAEPVPAGLRERALPRLSAGAAGTDRGRRLLGLAGGHAGPGPGTVPGRCPFELRQGLPRVAGTDISRGQSLGDVRSSYVKVYRELLAAGYTAVNSR